MNGLYPSLEIANVNWFKAKRAARVSISQKCFRNEAVIIAKKLGLSAPKAS